MGFSQLNAFFTQKNNYFDYRKNSIIKFCKIIGNNDKVNLIRFIRIFIQVE